MLAAVSAGSISWRCQAALGFSGGLRGLIVSVVSTTDGAEESKVLVMVGLVAALMAATVGVASAQGVPDLCVSVNGVDRVDLGTATCFSTVSDGAANVARASGDAAFAEAGFVAGDSGNRATATGDGAAATASSGDNNTVTATGDLAFAFADDGDSNTATATGDGANAGAFSGDNNTATATATGACTVIVRGDDQTDSCTGP